MHLLIAAAGSGSRMGATKNKLLLPLASRAVIAWTLDAAILAEEITWIGIVGQKVDQEEITHFMKASPKPIQWIEGGKTRQESIKRGLAGLPQGAKHVLIHDGARCLVESELFNRCAKLVVLGKAVIAAVPVTDTIKRVDNKGLILGTPCRSELWAAQTPQGFAVDQLKEAHAIADAKNWSVTDDASLYESLGWPVEVLEAPSSNIKVTTPFDLLVAESVISFREKA
ncbi:2-C-methyl-D-erythritol 4-phosphate cytidylyltransferase [Prochlorococcus sp. MIT 1341]|uniref:2-C-methyl-D-erythritol 4-phosphate cytidylyltransferase n=1 Tax=Prochlorococcus sp. MIT 1341 TaxID=3096221 RepID=UPI002A7660D5|nr:2-C-methyl-D-erythritol 4-phosphate cytidylyltransferase [Prochlorococcus sp. MIT 1341]